MDGTTAADTGSATTGPATFSDTSLSWQEDSSASTPTQDTPAADSASADATAPPADATASDGITPAAGEPPKERWNDILANARAKAAEDAMAPYAWAKQVNQADVQEAVRIAQLAQRDPIAYLQEFVKDLQSHPTYGAQLKSLAARALAQRSQPQGPDLNPIPVQLENGQTIGLYSADQIAALKQQWLGEVEQRFQPVTKTIETLQAREAAAQQQQQVEHFVSTTFADVQTWPGMQDKANQKAVADELATVKVDSDDPREVTIALNAAWRKVVAPKLSQSAQSALLDTLKTKAAASTSVNPGSAGASTSKSINSFKDLPAEAWR